MESKKGFSINIDHENRLIRYKHCGSIRKDDIGQAWRKFLELKEFTHEKYDLLSDYRNAAFIMDSNDVKLIVGFLYNIKDILKGKNQALVVEDPKSTAISLLFEDEVYHKTGFNVKIFSSYDQAFKWLRD